jgi:hypothetical protein
MEIWACNLRYPMLEVSSHGQIRRIYTLRNGIKRHTPAFSKSPNGYLQVPICKNHRKTLLRVNVLVCDTFHGPKPTAIHQAAHRDDNRLDNRADNLAWETPKQNAEARVQRNRQSRGEYHGQAKLKESEVVEIIQLRKWGHSFKRLAKEFKVSPALIQRIDHNLIWRHLSR